MRLAQRNLREVTYCTYQGLATLLDSEGFETGENVKSYSKPMKKRMSVSAANGNVQSDIFGNITQYDRVLITDDPKIKVDENSIFFIERPYTEKGGLPEPDYVVAGIARSLNYVSIAVKQVSGR
jgi:hypothetical protein